ncbi:MAG: Glucosaminyl phosphatidylinositol (GlcN-PI) nositol acylation protein [Piccolia ochrophora]|nr:MAG: Glucosaminyl phosphatidylinositol (GlcN-PI) nositol acylation protein [Piccolia ochrophora]
MATTYKAQKEDFVSNLRGGSISEINYVTAVAPAAVILWSALQSRLSFFDPYTPLAFTVDVLLNTGAILLAVTLYSSNPLLLSTLLLSPAVLLIALLPRAKPAQTPRKPAQNGTTPSPSTSPRKDPLPRKPFLTTYRGAMLAVTNIAILAVDFRVFPRRFAKVETWGTSLMDLGVGSFVFSAGLVSARAALKGSSSSSSAASSLPSRLLASTRHSLPLFVLGLARLLSVKNLDYAEHVSEYGVHWNFFFTLALLPPAVSLLPPSLSSPTSTILPPLLLLAAYQLTLSFTPLTSYILTAPRGPDLLSQNREGLCSLAGYLCIFLSGRSVGCAILPASPPPSPRRGDNAAHRSLRRTLLTTHRVPFLLAQHALAAAALYALLASPLTRRFSLTPSRRLANAPYVLWVHAFNAAQLAAFYFVDAAFFASSSSSSSTTRDKSHESTMTRTPPVLAAFNNNGLAIFLLANLLTGGVNMGVRTLEAGRGAAVGVLVAYVAVLAGTAVGMERWGVGIRL